MRLTTVTATAVLAILVPVVPGTAAAAPPAAVAAACPHAADAPGARGTSDARDALLCVINGERRRRDLPALRADVHLRQAAQGWADRLGATGNLVDTRGSSTPERRIAAAGYAGGDPKAFAFGETLGRSGGDAGAPSTRVRAWLSAPATRKVLLGRAMRDIGIGIHATADTTTYVVDLGARRGTVIPKKRTDARR